MIGITATGEDQFAADGQIIDTIPLLRYRNLSENRYSKQNKDS